jgi:hypothetical protein
LTPERLAQDDVFVTVVMQTSQIALRNHQVEKLEALRNAVLNSVLSTIEEDEKFVFLRLIDQLTPLHLRTLKFLDDPGAWMQRHGMQNPGWSMGGVSTVLEHCFPQLRGRRDVYEPDCERPTNGWACRLGFVSPHDDDSRGDVRVAHEHTWQGFLSIHYCQLKFTIGRSVGSRPVCSRLPGASVLAASMLTRSDMISSCSRSRHSTPRGRSAKRLLAARTGRRSSELESRQNEKLCPDIVHVLFCTHSGSKQPVASFQW